MNIEIFFFIGLLLFLIKYVNIYHSQIKNEGDWASSMRLPKFLINVDSWHKWKNKTYFICFNPFDNKTLGFYKLKWKF